MKLSASWLGNEDGSERHLEIDKDKEWTVTLLVDDPPEEPVTISLWARNANCPTSGYDVRRPPEPAIVSGDRPRKARLTTALRASEIWNGREPRRARHVSFRAKAGLQEAGCSVLAIPKQQARAARVLLLPMAALMVVLAVVMRLLDPDAQPVEFISRVAGGAAGSVVSAWLAAQAFNRFRLPLLGLGLRLRIAIPALVMLVLATLFGPRLLYVRVCNGTEYDLAIQHDDSSFVAKPSCSVGWTVQGALSPRGLDAWLAKRSAREGEKPICMRDSEDTQGPHRCRDDLAWVRQNWARRLFGVRTVALACQDRQATVAASALASPVAATNGLCTIPIKDGKCAALESAKVNVSPAWLRERMPAAPYCGTDPPGTGSSVTLTLPYRGLEPTREGQQALAAELASSRELCVRGLAPDSLAWTRGASERASGFQELRWTGPGRQRVPLPQDTTGKVLVRFQGEKPHGALTCRTETRCTFASPVVHTGRLQTLEVRESVGQPASSSYAAVEGEARGWICLASKTSCSGPPDRPGLVEATFALDESLTSFTVGFGEGEHPRQLVLKPLDTSCELAGPQVRIERAAVSAGARRAKLVWGRWVTDAAVVQGHVWFCRDEQVPRTVFVDGSPATYRGGRIRPVPGPVTCFVKPVDGEYQPDPTGTAARCTDRLTTVGLCPLARCPNGCWICR